MNKLNRNGLILLGVMSIVLPFWLTFGKALMFGIGGWMALIYLMTAAPAIFVIFWVFFILLALRKDVQATKSIGIVDTFLLLATYASIFLHGFFLVDGGDTKESVNSVASKHFDMTHEISTTYSMVFLAVSTLLIFVSFGIFIYELMKKSALKSNTTY